MPSDKMQNPAGEHLLQQNDDSAATEKRRLEASVGQQFSGSSVTSLETESRRRYWIRSLFAIIIPLIVAAYFGVIWVYWVLGTPVDEAVKCRTFSGSLVFYSWFLIGVFALSWSTFGLMGIEAGMLYCSRFWAAPDLGAFLLHSDGTWSSPSGWFKAIKGRQIHRLWSLLAFVSFLPFIAIPLSGLVFEIGDGYIIIAGTPMVEGRNISTFNERYEHDTASVVIENGWEIGAAPVIPGFGVIYTNETLDRSEYSIFERVPNTLPLDQSLPDIFLAPQGDKPVAGKAWGLRVKYDCSIVRSASEFTILNQKSASSIIEPSCGTLGRNCIKLDPPTEGDVITLWNSTGGLSIPNVQAYHEVGMNGIGMPRKYQGEHLDYELEEGENSVVLEYAAWQYRASNEYFSDEKEEFNSTVESPIEGMGSPFIESGNGTFALNTTFFAMRGDRVGNDVTNGTSTNSSVLVEQYLAPEGARQVFHVAPPIGARCVVSSSLGAVELDAVTSTFRNFVRQDPEFHPAYRFGPDVLGFRAQKVLETGSFYSNYIAGGLSGKYPHENGERYKSFVDGPALVRSMNLAFALEAHDLMYGVTSGFRGPWPYSNLTTSREGKVLGIASLIPGSEVGYLVLAMLCVWALLSAGLAIWYGFRARPADRVDGYVMLRKGADLAEELRGDKDFGSRKAFQGNTHESRL